MAIEQIESSVVIPTNPADQAKIKKIMEDVSLIMSSISIKRDEIKELKKAIVDDYKIPVKLVNRMCKTFHAENFQKETAIDETFSVLYETITKEKSE